MPIDSTGRTEQPGFAEVPHDHAHRERLRDRFRKAGTDALSDYELARARAGVVPGRCRAATSSR
jgi:hypothetical protein